MLITKREEVTKQGFCKILWRKLLKSLIRIYSFKWLEWGWALIWVWLGGGGGGRLFEAGRLLTFSAFGMDAYSRWALIRGWALIRIIKDLINEWFIPTDDSQHGNSTGLLSRQTHSVENVSARRDNLIEHIRVKRVTCACQSHGGIKHVRSACQKHVH